MIDNQSNHLELLRIMFLRLMSFWHFRRVSCARCYLQSQWIDFKKFKQRLEDEKVLYNLYRIDF